MTQTYHSKRELLENALREAYNMTEEYPFEDAFLHLSAAVEEVLIVSDPNQLALGL